MGREGGAGLTWELGEGERGPDGEKEQGWVSLVLVGWKGWRGGVIFKVLLSSASGRL